MSVRKELRHNNTLLLYIFGVFTGVLMVLIHENSSLVPGSTYSEANQGEGCVHSSVAETGAHPDPLYDEVKILCWVMTSPQNLKKKAQHIKATWWKRCNTRFFMSSKEDSDLPAVGLNVAEGRGNLYTKTKEAFKFVWEHCSNDADWFMKADDDTYVILDNLRRFLRDKDPNNPVYYGRKFKPHVKKGYMSGGSGYVLSREALKRYVLAIASDSPQCRNPSKFEDVAIGKCLESLGVEAGDSRDSEMKEMFHPRRIERYTWDGKPNVIDYDFNPTCDGINCTTSWPISFHYVGPELMHLYDYFFYHAQTNGRCVNS